MSAKDFSPAIFFDLTKGSLVAQLPRRPWRTDLSQSAEMIFLRLSADGKSLLIENAHSHTLTQSFSLSELIKVRQNIINV
jgi:hypothetical protein